MDTRLHAAAEAGDLAAIEALLADGANVDGRDARGRTPLMAATHANQPDAFARLLAAGADVDLQDERRDNPFLYAGAEGLDDILRLAIGAGADVRLTNRYGGVALIPACHHGHIATVRILLTESAVDIDHVNRLGWTALLETVLLGDGDPVHQEILGLLLDAGADPDIPDGDGVTALEHARSRGYSAMVARLEAARSAKQRSA